MTLGSKGKKKKKGTKISLFILMSREEECQESGGENQGAERQDSLVFLWFWGGNQQRLVSGSNQCV